MSQTRRILRLTGTDLEEAHVAAAGVERRIRADRHDNVEISTIFSHHTDTRYNDYLNELRAALRNSEQPLVYVEAHGLNNTVDGRHTIDLRGDDLTTVRDDWRRPLDWLMPHPAPALPAVLPQEVPPPATRVTQQIYEHSETAEDTAQFFERLLNDYRNIYHEIHGAQSEPPRLTVMLTSCYSEGLLRDLTPDILRQADFIVGDSRQRVTFQSDSRHVLDDMAHRGSAEEIFVWRLLESMRPEDTQARIYSLPALATPNGVVDGHSLSERVTAENFAPSHQRALVNLERLPSSLRDAARRSLEAAHAANFAEEGYEHVRGLIGYLAHYEDRYTPLSHYRQQGELMRRFYAPGATTEELLDVLRQMEPNHRDGVMNFDMTDLPQDYLEHPNHANDDGVTPLQVAAMSDNMRGIRVLLALGADPNSAGPAGTALYQAAFGGRSEIVQALLAAGARPNVQSREGFTPLAQAAYAGHEDTVRLLLEHGAEVNTPSHNGITPLLVASYAGHTNIISMLREQGARDDRVDLDRNGELTTAEARTWVIAQNIEPWLPEIVDPFFDANRDGRSSAMEVAGHLVRAGVGLEAAIQPGALLEHMGRIANTPANPPREDGSPSR